MPPPLKPSSLSIDRGELVYRETGGTEMWRLPIADILLIAERTTDGSLGDDYFLEFATLRDGEAFLTTCATPGNVDSSLEQLGAVLGCDLSLRLKTSCVFASRILWPEKLSGKALFVERSAGSFSDAFRYIRKFFKGTLHWEVSPEVLAAIQPQARTSGEDRQ